MKRLVFSLLMYLLFTGVVSIKSEKHAPKTSFWDQVNWELLGKSFEYILYEYIVHQDDQFDNNLFAQCMPFTCRNNVKPTQNKNYRRTHNGCGTRDNNVDFALSLLNMPSLTECCNDHDICYDTCNKKKEKCDQNFKRCLLGKCKNYADKDENMKCNGLSHIMFEGVKILGCDAFEKSQKQSCLCNYK